MSAFECGYAAVLDFVCSAKIARVTDVYRHALCCRGAHVLTLVAGGPLLILDNATLIDLDAGELRPGHFITIDGDSIAAVEERRPQSYAAERIDLAGKCLLPGLIDAHFHATLTDTNPANLRDVPTTLMTARAASLLRGALDRGFTTVRDMGGADWGLRTAVAEGSIVGPRVYIAGRALSQTGGHGDLRRRVETESFCSCTQRLGIHVGRGGWQRWRAGRHARATAPGCGPHQSVSVGRRGVTFRSARFGAVYG